jgi:hypothetical protein
MTTEPDKKFQGEECFSVFAKKTGSDKGLLMNALTFARLLDDVVHPYKENKPFFIDGRTVTQGELDVIKIVKEGSEFGQRLEYFLRRMRIPRTEEFKLSPEKFDLYLESLIRDQCEDVTSQVINAYDSAQGKFKKYLKEQDWLDFAHKVFTGSLKLLGAE